MAKKKILFSHSYFYPLDPKQWKNKTPYPPLATILVAANMRELGYEIGLFDTNLLDSPSKLKSRLLADKPDYFVVYDDGFNYLSKMCLTNMRDAAREMIKMAKAEGLKVVVSSSDSSDHYEKYIEAGADAVLIGEGEEALKEVIEHYDEGKELTEGIAGIAFMQEGKVVKTNKRTVLKNLDQLPLPAWDLVDMDAYKQVWDSGKYTFSLNIATTRGCPFKCNWCAKPIYGQRYNTRSPEHVVKEIKYLVETFGVTRFWMCDDIFGLKPGWVQEFNTVLKAEHLKIQYKIQSRADLLLKEDTIDALAESGLYEVWIGAESGSQKILDAMDKGITTEQIESATKLLQQKAVKVAYFLQLGYLGENTEDIDMTIAMLKNNKPDDIGVSVSYPLPGTPFFDKVKSELGTKANWTDSDELAMMFQGTFNSEFYKKLHRYIHRLFRSQQGKRNLSQLLRFKRPTEGRTLLTLPLNLCMAAVYRMQLKSLKNQKA